MPRRKNNKNPEKNRFRWAIAIGAAVVLIAAVGAFFALSSGSNSRTAEAATGDVLAPPSATIDENCVISILNRSARVKPDGSWRIDNLPANLGRVRARVTCIRDGEVESGQSDLFSIEANVVNGFNSEIPLGVVDPIPTSIEITADSTVLANVGDTTQLTVTATFPDGSTRDVSAASDGTNSNPEVVSVSPTGQVTALASGTVVISALFEGVLGLIQIQVVLDGDSDRDGVPDDLELANGLDPRNGVDGLEDPDVDGLTNKEELVDVGSDMRISDTDGDSLLDGEEVSEANGYVTSALIADSDGDGVRDGLEIATGSDPTNAISVNLAGALDSIEVTPSDFFLSVDPSVGDSSQQVITTGHLADGTDIDLTSTARGTSYSSSDLTICNFGGQPGQVFAGNDGTCLVTVENSGHSASVTVVVRSFAPFGITSIAIPGYANNVDAVSDDFAYVAAGSAGLQVVNVSNLLGSPNLPSGRIVGSLDTPGTSIDIKVVGNLAYIADGEAGLHIVDISNPTNPATRGTVDTPGTAQDLAVVGDKVYIADGGGGLQIIDVGNPSAPRILGSVATDRNAKGVDVSGNLAVVAANVDFLVIDVADATNPQIVGRINQAGNLKDLVVRGNQAYVAAYTSGFLVVDFSTPENPKILSRISSRGRRGFVPRDVALSGQFALAAEQLFPNVVAIADIGDPNEARFRDTLDLAPLGDYAGTGIALTGRFVYVTEASFVVRSDFEADGNTRLFIGQYQAEGSGDRSPPSVSIASPAPGEKVFENTRLSASRQRIVEDTILNVTIEASDNVGISSVQLLVDGQVTDTDTAAPYEFTVALSPGVSSVTLAAQATDRSGNVGSSGDLLVVVAPDPPPTLVIAPEEGTELVQGTEVSFFAEVSDNGTVQSFDLTIYGFSTPYPIGARSELVLLLPVGEETFAITGSATDNLGQTSAKTFTFELLPDPAPKISITSPAQGEMVAEGTTLELAAEVTDNVDVISVKFKVDGETFTELFSPPYTAQYFVPIAPTVTAAASSVPPHVFVGGVTINGIPAPDGTIVAAWIDAAGSSELTIEVIATDNLGQSSTETRVVNLGSSRTKVAETNLIGGNFSVLVNQPQGVSYAGKTVSFTVNGLNVGQTAPWEQGGGTEMSLILVR